MDSANQLPIKLYGDKCKSVKRGSNGEDSILIKDLSILKRPLSSIVVLDVRSSKLGQPSNYDRVHGKHVPHDSLRWR